MAGISSSIGYGFFEEFQQVKLSGYQAGIGDFRPLRELIFPNPFKMVF
jgi:hypothetical protein